MKALLVLCAIYIIKYGERAKKGLMKTNSLAEQSSSLTNY